MKLFGTVVFVVGLALGVAYIGGVFDVETKVTVNEQVKDDVAELTYDTISEAQESADKAINKLKKKIKE